MVTRPDLRGLGTRRIRSLAKSSVLIAGCGSIGKRHARVLSGLGVRDLRACDPAGAACLAAGAGARSGCTNPSRRAWPTARHGLICTPPWLHVPQAMQAITPAATCSARSRSPTRPTASRLVALAAARAQKSHGRASASATTRGC